MVTEVAEELLFDDYLSDVQSVFANITNNGTHKFHDIKSSRGYEGSVVFSFHMDFTNAAKAHININVAEVATEATAATELSLGMGFGFPNMLYPEPKPSAEVLIPDGLDYQQDMIDADRAIPDSDMGTYSESQGIPLIVGITAGVFGLKNKLFCLILFFLNMVYLIPSF